MTSNDLNKLSRSELINEKDKEKLIELLKSHKITSDEYAVLKQIMQRAPTFAELGIFSAMWSEHCSYKSSRVHLGRFPTEGKQVVQGPGENAGVVHIAGDLCAAFKMESHNHPSYIEPYQGAATGVGGILRDVFCMGARPVANLNCLRFGARSHKKSSYLFSEVVKGIGDYGNCVGIPTVGGNISFDRCYDGNILVNAMTVGLIHKDRIFKGFATGIGNKVVYVGSATGRDGIHGATMASDSFASADEGERSTVQVGDPFTEKLLLEATLEVLEKDLVVGLQDMGAAGLASSSFEMASRAGSGLYLDLDKVPVRTNAMSAYELMLSESQERMLMVIEPSKWDQISAVFEKWQLSYNVIGEVTNSGRVQAIKDGMLEIDVPVDPITENAPKYRRPLASPSGNWSDTEKQVNEAFVRAVEKDGGEQLLAKVFAELGEPKPIYHQYDRHIGNKSVLESSDGGAAVIHPRSPWAGPEHADVGIAISTACYESYCAKDPKMGAATAVAKCARAIAAAGGQPLAITDCLNYGNPEDPEIMSQFSQGVDGISEACLELDTPVVSGNVSLYNETDGVSISPTPMIGMVGKIERVQDARPAVLLNKSEAQIIWLKSIQASLRYGGSLLEKILGRDSGEPIPNLYWPSEKAAVEFLRNARPIKAARDVGRGGLASAVAKLCRQGGYRANHSANMLSLKEWFGEGFGYVLAIDKSVDPEDLFARLSSELSWMGIGACTGDASHFDFGSFSITADELDRQEKKGWLI